jgi:hypothetical protein
MPVAREVAYHAAAATGGGLVALDLALSTSQASRARACVRWPS